MAERVGALLDGKERLTRGRAHRRRAGALLPDYLGKHVLLSVTALAAGPGDQPAAGDRVACARPALRAGGAGGRQHRANDPEPGAAGAVLSAAAGAVGADRAHVRLWLLGARLLAGSLLALTLYSHAADPAEHASPGIDGIDPAITRGRARRRHDRAAGARAWSSCPWPLPVIMAGVRTAAVWVIGTATLSTPIGQTSLGNYIFAGLQTQNWIFVLFGCAAAAVLALAVDQLLALIERGYSARNRNRVAAGGIGLAPYRCAGPRRQPVGWKTAAYVIGAKPFAEQYILVALMEDRLRANGLAADAPGRPGLGRHLRGARRR